MKSVCHSDAEELHITELSAPELEVDEVEHDVRESLLLLQVQAACRQCTKGGAFIKSGVQRDCRHLWRHSTTSNRLELKAFASRLFTLGVAFVFLVYFETGRVSVDIEKVTKTQAHTHTTHTHTHTQNKERGASAATNTRACFLLAGLAPPRGAGDVCHRHEPRSRAGAYCCQHAGGG